MVLLDLIAREFAEIEIFSLDTGRLPEETHRLMQTVKTRYGVPIRVYLPETRSVEEYAARHAPNCIYESIDLRERCCHIRKVEPLKRALAPQH